MPRYPQKSKSDYLENCKRQLAEWSQSRKLLGKRYRIERSPLDKGGFGLIVKAKDVILKRDVVIKVLYDLDNEKKRRHFKSEATTLANLQHPLLPTALDYFDEGGWQFFVMQFVEGKNLAKLLRSKEDFTIEEKLRWLDDLLEVVHHLHSQKTPVVHRDIKPSNIILTNQGKVVLVDFGIAKGVPDSMLLLTETLKRTTSILACSLPYAPIEQVMDLGTDTPSDIYSLHATFYHLFTGRQPLLAKQRWSEFNKDGRDPLPPAHQVNPAIPTSLSDLISQGMAIEAKDRPSAEQMRQRLAQVRAEIAQPGQEMEELLRGASNKANAIASAPNGVDHNSSGFPVSPADIKKVDSWETPKEIEDVVLRLVKKTRKPERPTDVKAPAASNRRLLKQIMMMSIAACLILVITVTMISNYLFPQSMTDLPDISKEPQQDWLDELSEIIASHVDNSSRLDWPQQRNKQLTVGLKPTNRKQDERRTAATGRGRNKATETARRERVGKENGQKQIEASNKRGRKGSQQVARDTSKPPRRQRESLARLRDYPETRGRYRGTAIGYAIARNNAGNSEARLGHYPKAMNQYNKAYTACKTVARCKPDLAHTIVHNQGIVYGLLHAASTSTRPHVASNRKKDMTFGHRTGKTGKQYKSARWRTPSSILNYVERRHLSR